MSKSANTILIIGDVMLDKYWHATSESMAEEAPVAQVAVNKTDYRAGGAANVALNIKMLAHSSTKVGILAPIGRDHAGSQLKKILDKANIDTYWQYDSNIPTITKHRILSNNHQLVRVDFERRCKAISLTDSIKQLINNYKVIVISDYNKGALDKVSEIISYAKSLNKRILVDPKGNDFIKYKGASILTPNFKEFTDIVGPIDISDINNSNNDTTKAIADKANKLIQNLELDNLLLTLGAHGMRLFCKTQQSYHACSYAQQVYDVTGAGDTVIASMAVSFAEDKDYESAIEYASHAAALVVSQVGTGFATRSQVERSMLQHSKQLSIDKTANNIGQLEQDTKNKIESKLVDVDCLDFLDRLESKDPDKANKVNKDNEILFWDFKQDNILNAKNISRIMKLKQSINKNQGLWVCIYNNLLDNTNAQLAQQSPQLSHSLIDLAYCLGQISVIDKVIYSNNIDLYPRFANNYEINESHEAELELE